MFRDIEMSLRAMPWSDIYLSRLFTSLRFLWSYINRLKVLPIHLSTTHNADKLEKGFLNTHYIHIDTSCCFLGSITAKLASKFKN